MSTSKSRGGEDTCSLKVKGGYRAAEKMFYPNWLDYELVFCVADSRTYPDMHDCPRLEYEPIS
jgi:hypothetical protein